MDAFDADSLIYAGIEDHPLGRRVRALLAVGPVDHARRHCVGSVLLLPEVLSKPTRDGDTAAIDAFRAILGRLDLRPVERRLAEMAVDLAAKYRLRAVDATHLATAVDAGADRFITNNRRDFPKSITEVDITYPSDLVDPEPGR